MLPSGLTEHVSWERWKRDLRVGPLGSTKMWRQSTRQRAVEMAERCKAWKTMAPLPTLPPVLWKTPGKLASPTFPPLLRQVFVIVSLRFMHNCRLERRCMDRMMPSMTGQGRQHDAGIPAKDPRTAPGVLPDGRCAVLIFKTKGIAAIAGFIEVVRVWCRDCLNLHWGRTGQPCI